MAFMKKIKTFVPCYSLRFYSGGSSESPYSRNDCIAPRMKNRNPLNLERMLIGKKPRGFDLEDKSREYWNKLELEISNNHTTAIVTHWTGRMVAQASTKEWPIRQFLYNLTDKAALKVVGQVISQRCLETGVSEVLLQVSEEDKEKEKMKKFISVIEESGLSLSEPEVYQPTNPHVSNFRKIQHRKIKPWTILEQEN